MTNFEKIEQFIHDYYHAHFTEIPKCIIDEIDWDGYGWPLLDCGGHLIGYGGYYDYPETRGMAQVVVYDKLGSEWMLEYDEDDDEPPVPDGMTLEDITARRYSKLYDIRMSSPEVTRAERKDDR